MDAYRIAVSVPGITPDYFWYHMDLVEFETIIEIYREDWEKTRLIASAMGAKIELPWDKEPNPERDAKKHTAADRLQIASQLTDIMNNRKN